MIDLLTLSRIQFGGTAAFHILWPLLSIGLALYMFIMEAMWLKTKDESYYRQTRFWSKIFILSFVIGTASGIPLEFEFGTNWAAFSASAGDFFGNILGFESTIAFALEAAFLGIFVFGWKRVPPAIHLFSNGMVALGATLSAFWIMVANSWMQVPVGVTLEGTKILVTDYMVAIFNPGSLTGFAHMEVACIETTLFFIMGLCGAMILNKKYAHHHVFYLQAFKVALILSVIATPLQIFLGDLSGQVVAEHQPQKLAALELHWDTNAPGTGASWAVVAWPNQEGTGNAFEVQVPNVLSLLTTHTLDGTVQGLNSFESNDRPNKIESLLTFYSFRIMVVIGIGMFIMMLWGLAYWKKGWLKPEVASQNKWFWWFWIFGTPLGFIATEAGWMVREIGRQPYIVYHLMRTSDGVSPNLATSAVATTTILFLIFYAVFVFLFWYYIIKIMKKGPDLTSPIAVYIPHHQKNV